MPRGQPRRDIRRPPLPANRRRSRNYQLMVRTSGGPRQPEGVSGSAQCRCDDRADRITLTCKLRHLFDTPREEANCLTILLFNDIEVLLLPTLSARPRVGEPK